MYCSKCGSLEDKVIDSRLAKDGRSIRRRRECIACSHRYTTYEEIERADLRVVKRDGRSEPFDRHKLQTGMVKAAFNTTGWGVKPARLFFAIQRQFTASSPTSGGLHFRRMQRREKAKKWAASGHDAWCESTRDAIPREENGPCALIASP